jgi:hypothetical protein
VEIDEKPQQRGPNGQFLPGNRAAIGRPKNIPNKLTTSNRHSIISAAARHGRDGKGLDGEAGWLDYLAKERPSEFTELYKRTIPPAKDEESASTGTGDPIFYIVPIQSGHFVSCDGAELLTEAQAREAAGLPLLRDPITIENEPAEALEPEDTDGGALISMRTRAPIDDGSSGAPAA